MTGIHEDRWRACSFGSDPERYDRARPTYPPALLDDLIPAGGCRVLDVGCGTGIVARLLAARGCEVLGVEPDARMAAVARSHGIAVEAGTFEAWDPRGRRFDLLTSGQAWHWVDPEGGARKAALVLEPAGRLAVFWNTAVWPADLKAAIDAAYRRQAPELDGYSVLLGNEGRRRYSEAAASLRRCFESVEIRSYPHDVVYTTDGWLDQLPTHSDHAALPAPRLARLLDDVGAAIDRFGGRFVMRYDAWVVLAREPVAAS